HADDPRVGREPAHVVEPRTGLVRERRRVVRPPLEHDLAVDRQRDRRADPDVSERGSSAHRTTVAHACPGRTCVRASGPTQKRTSSTDMSWRKGPCGCGYSGYGP